VVVCLAAVAEEERPAFFEKLLVPLRELRAATGRPHWFLVDEASDILSASGAASKSPAAAADNTIYVTAEPASLAPAILASVDGIAAGGAQAAAMLDAFAAAASWPRPELPARVPHEGESLVWLRKSPGPVALIDLARSRPDVSPPLAEFHQISAEVGQVLRRA
jgi:hypothetical protein